MHFHLSAAGHFAGEAAAEAEQAFLADFQAFLKKHGKYIVTSFFSGPSTGTLQAVHASEDIPRSEDSTASPPEAAGVRRAESGSDPLVPEPGP